MKLNFNLVARIFLILLMGLTNLSAKAQRSGLNIVTSSVPNATLYDLRAGIDKSIATLRKEVVKDKTEKAVPLPAIQKETPIKEISKKPTLPIVVTPVLTSTTIYDIPGSAAALQYTSLQASFKFLYTDITSYSANTPAGVVELYKLEKGTSSRSFSIPSGSCSAVNIPIQIMADGQLVTPSTESIPAGGAAGKSPVYMVVIPSGYLQPGEYAFIDKSSLKADGSALICFCFGVR